MKSLKIVLASLLLTASVIGFSSFIAKSFNPNAFARECFEYTGSTNPPTAVGQIDWNATPVDFTTFVQAICTGGDLWCAVCIDGPNNNLYIDAITGKPTADLNQQIFDAPKVGQTKQFNPTFVNGQGQRVTDANTTVTLYYFEG